jgi:hypothetical protein
MRGRQRRDRVVCGSVIPVGERREPPGHVQVRCRTLWGTGRAFAIGQSAWHEHNNRETGGSRTDPQASNRVLKYYPAVDTSAQTQLVIFATDDARRDGWTALQLRQRAFGVTSMSGRRRCAEAGEMGCQHAELGLRDEQTL